MHSLIASFQVLDMCAAPGSKTAQIIELLHQDENKPIPGESLYSVTDQPRDCYVVVILETGTSGKFLCLVTVIDVKCFTSAMLVASNYYWLRL